MKFIFHNFRTQKSEDENKCVYNKSSAWYITKYMGRYEYQFQSKIISNRTQWHLMGYKNLFWVILSIQNLLLILSVSFITIILGNRCNQMASTNLTRPNSSSVQDTRWQVTTCLEESFVNKWELGNSVTVLFMTDLLESYTLLLSLGTSHALYYNNRAF
jgi:hypothetical protein